MDQAARRRRSAPVAPVAGGMPLWTSRDCQAVARGWDWEEVGDAHPAMWRCKNALAVVISGEGSYESYESYGHDQIRSTSCFFLDFTADGGLSVEASNGNPSSLAESPLDLSTSAVYIRYVTCIYKYST